MGNKFSTTRKSASINAPLYQFEEELYSLLNHRYLHNVIFKKAVI
jgi:hypothetical protein